MKKDRRLIIIGAGGHAKVVASTAQAAGYTVDAIYDDSAEKLNQSLLGIPVLGVHRIPDEPKHLAVIGMADAAARKAHCERLNLTWSTLVHPTAYVHSSVELGSGTVIFAGAVLQPDTKVGNHAIVNTGATVDHDCILEDFVQLAPGVHLSGDVHIAEGAFLGTGASVLQGIGVGAWSVIGAGAVVIRDLPNHVVAVGCPAEIIKAKRR